MNDPTLVHSKRFRIGLNTARVILAASLLALLSTACSQDLVIIGEWSDGTTTMVFTETTLTWGDEEYMYLASSGSGQFWTTDATVKTDFAYSILGTQLTITFLDQTLLLDRQ